MWSLFLGNLSSHVRHQDLENAFRRFGRSKLELKDGFGFVIYDEHRDAERALKALKGKPICGENLSISWAKKHRPFQRLSGKPNSTRRGSWEKHDNRGNRVQSSLENDRVSEGDRRTNHFLDETKDGVRTSIDNVREGEGWKDQGLTFDDEGKDVDPLDTGRWDPRSEGSPPDHIIIDDNREDEIGTLDEKEDDRGGIRERPRSSPEDKHHQRLSQGHQFSHDKYKRGHDAAMGKTHEKCYNCGEFGHVKWQCRSRPRVNSIHLRDGYDGRRNDMRYFRGGGPFRNVGGGGRFRGIDGSRRMFNRDMEGNYRRNNLPRHNTTVGRRNHDLNNGKPNEDSKRRRRPSESPEGSSSRDKSKKKPKRSNKKSLQSIKKSRKLSSDSQAHSGSPKASSSSIQSKSHSQSGSKSHSKSGSGSPFQTSSSVSHSKKSRSKSSRSRSRSSSSPARSHSVSSHSHKSDNNRSQSRTESQQASHSSHSHNSLSISLKAKQDSSPSHATKQGSPFRYEDDKEGIVFNKHGQLLSDDDKCDHMSESPETEQEYLISKDRRHQGSAETQRQKFRSESDGEHQLGFQTNGSEKNASETVKSGAETSMGDLHCNVYAYQDLDLKCRLYMNKVHNHEKSQESEVSNYSAARLWPWEAILYRRLKRGLISTENYQRRLAQNFEFGIKDKFVRSSSGWWEKPLH